MTTARAFALVAISVASLVSACGGGGSSGGSAENSAPVASFVVAPDSGPAPLSAQFDATATTDADGSVASYSWNFGDSTPAASGVTAGHVFQAAGTYAVTLTVKDSGGATASVTRQVIVSEPMPAKVDVPNVVGMTQVDASAAIGSAGLNVGTVTTAESVTVAAGSVISQTPVGGTSFPRNSTVDLMVSSGSQVPPAGTFSLTVEPPAIGVPQGSGALVRLSITRGQNFSESVSVTLDQPPPGIEAGTMTFSGPVSRGYLPISVAENATLGTVNLSLLGAAANSHSSASVTLTVSAAVPAAQQKIAAGLSSGVLDYGTSLLYRAYALYGDRRLPDAYLGAGSVEEDNEVFGEISRAMASLSPSMQASLRPFMLRPANPESVWSAKTATAATMSKMQLPYKGQQATSPGPLCPSSSGSEAWISLRSATYPVRVWAKCSGDPYYNSESQHLLERTLSVLDKIYGPVTSLMGTPVTDEEGGDDAIDFYVVDLFEGVFRRDGYFGPQGLGSTYSDYPRVNDGCSAFVTLPRFLVYLSRFHTTVIHEFFHVLQKRHNCEFGFRPADYASNVYEAYWFNEASAVWASVHFDRVLAPWETGRAAYEEAHTKFVSLFLPNADAPLNAAEPPTARGRYSAYIWPYFVEQEMQATLGATNSPAAADFMGHIWAGLETVSTFEQADNVIDAQYPFVRYFKEFALRNLNRAFMPGDPLPITKRYVALDPIFPDFAEQGPHSGPPGVVPPEIDGPLAGDQEFRHEIELENLSARYVRLHVDDPSIMKVELDFAGVVPVDLTDVKALIRTTDGWVPTAFDFSDDSKVTFCFDDGPTTKDRRGSFQEMVLVLANHAKTKDGKVSGTFVARPSAKPCTTLWTGVVKRVFTGGKTDGSSETTVTTVADIKLKYNRTDDPDPITGKIARVFDLSEGNLRFDDTGHDNHVGWSCTHHHYAQVAMVPYSGGDVMDGSTEAVLDVWYLDGEPVEYLGGGETFRFPLKIEETCSDGTGRDEWIGAAWLWWDMYTEVLPFPEDGVHLSGSYDVDWSTAEDIYRDHNEWSLQQVRE